MHSLHSEPRPMCIEWHITRMHPSLGVNDSSRCRASLVPTAAAKLDKLTPLSCTCKAERLGRETASWRTCSPLTSHCALSTQASDLWPGGCAKGARAAIGGGGCGTDGKDGTSSQLRNSARRLPAVVVASTWQAREWVLRVWVASGAGSRRQKRRGCDGHHPMHSSLAPCAGSGSQTRCR